MKINYSIKARNLFIDMSIIYGNIPEKFCFSVVCYPLWSRYYVLPYRL